MRIQKVTDEYIMFDNGNTISFAHEQDCCEWNYADFSQIDEDLVDYDYDFDEKLEFEKIDESGFRFGSNGHWLFVPCYSEQNGYYSSDLEIYYNEKEVLNVICETHENW